MAQIIVTIIDNVNGAVNSTYRLEDKDIARIYNALSYRYAHQVLQQKEENGDVLEANDTIADILNNVPPQEILNSLTSMLVSRIITDTHDIETKRLIKEFYDKNGHIQAIETF